MPIEDGFLRAIIDEPDDDTHRLVYADWLDDHGQPERAEFIRVQITLARLPGEDPQRDALEARERALLAEHREEWAAPLRAWVAVDEFQRGFVEAVTARPEAFLEHAAALFQAAPVRRVHFQGAMFQLGVPHLVHLSYGPLMPRLAVQRYFTCVEDRLRRGGRGGRRFLRVPATTARFLFDCRAAWLRR
jgi:uncharacterized protein (TIGR02996 family)